MSAVIVSQASVSNAQSENNSQVNYGQLINIESTIEEIKTITQNPQENNSLETKSLLENKELNSAELSLDKNQKDTQTPEGTNSKDLETLPENKELTSNALTLEETKTLTPEKNSLNKTTVSTEETQSISAISNLEEKQTETLPEESEALLENTDLTAKVLTTEETLPLDVEEQIAQVSVLQEVSEEEMKLELTNLQDESVVGKTFGEVFNDQHIAESIIQAFYGHNRIEDYDKNLVKYDGNKISNIITQEYMNIEKLSYTSPFSEKNAVDLSGLKNFKNIKQVTVNFSNIPNFPLDLLELPNLTNITLTGITSKTQPVPFILPFEIVNLKNLTTLNLNNTRIKEIPSWINDMTSLTYLNLTGSNYNTSNEFIPPITENQLINLTKISLSNNNIKNLPSDLYKSKKLYWFDLINNSLEEISEDNYKFLKDIKENKETFTRVNADQQNVSVQGGEKNINQDINIDMPPIVKFLMTEENSISFKIYENGSSKQLDISEIYKNGIFTLEKDKVDANKNYTIIASTTGGLFPNSNFKYNFSTVKPQEETPDGTGNGEETPDDTSTGGEETPDDTSTGNGEETPDDTSTGNGEETPDDTSTGGEETPDGTSTGNGEETPDDTSTGGEETPDDTSTGNGEETSEVERPDEAVVIENKPEKFMAEKVVAENIDLEKTLMPFRSGMLPKAGEKDSNLLSIAMLFIITSIGSLFALLRKK